MRYDVFRAWVVEAIEDASAEQRMAFARDTVTLTLGTLALRRSINLTS